MTENFWCFKVLQENSGTDFEIRSQPFHYEFFSIVYLSFSLSLAAMRCKLHSHYVHVCMELVVHYLSGVANLSLCKRWSLIRQWVYSCVLSWTLRLTESLASLFSRWIVKVPPLRIEREFVESRAILLAVLKWRTSCFCQDSSHHQRSFSSQLPTAYTHYTIWTRFCWYATPAGSKLQPRRKETNSWHLVEYLLHFWRWKWKSGSETCGDEGNG
jgi:hypothetical protein